MSFTRYNENGLQIAAVERKSHSEYFITAQVGEEQSFEQLLTTLGDTLRSLEALPISAEVFGVDAASRPLWDRALEAFPCPVMWLTGRQDHSSTLQGFQLWAVSKITLEPIHLENQLVGMHYEMDGARWCRLTGLLPGDLAASRKEQTRSLFDSLEKALARAKMRFSQVARTWFYNHDMLEWYDDFNEVRTAFFEERTIFDQLVPASTGIGCRNGAGAALTAGLVALESGEQSLAPVAIPSPLQCPSIEYGSAFSRAVEFGSPSLRRLLISGTASIEPGGKSIHFGDMERQIHLTLCVVQAILRSRGMNWSQVSRAIAYFKDAADAPLFAKCMTARGIAPIPVLLAHTDICRDDLLFELELDALL
ncbi:MAG: endoribonuclease L-PSP [Candidatus Hydrogenedens sp.]|nr:endoribonuclease L-PSP [Candidatus Hydrogenedens sp.]